MISLLPTSIAAVIGSHKCCLMFAALHPSSMSTCLLLLSHKRALSIWSVFPTCFTERAAFVSASSQARSGHFCYSLSSQLFLSSCYCALATCLPFFPTIRSLPHKHRLPFSVHIATPYSLLCIAPYFPVRIISHVCLFLLFSRYLSVLSAESQLSAFRFSYLHAHSLYPFFSIVCSGQGESPLSLEMLVSSLKNHMTTYISPSSLLASCLWWALWLCWCCLLSHERTRSCVSGEACHST